MQTEANKQGFVRKEAKGLPSLLAALKAFGASDPALVAAACVALRTVCTFDDLRKDFAGAFDSAKAAVDLGFVTELLRLAKRHEAHPRTMTAIFYALRAIAQNDMAVQQVWQIVVDVVGRVIARARKREAGFFVIVFFFSFVFFKAGPFSLLNLTTTATCIQTHTHTSLAAGDQVCMGGGLACAEHHLSVHASDPGVCRQAAALLRNLAGNDGVRKGDDAASNGPT